MDHWIRQSLQVAILLDIQHWFINAWLGWLIRLFVFDVYHNTELCPESVICLVLFWFDLGYFFDFFVPLLFLIHRYTWFCFLETEYWTRLREGEKIYRLSVMISLETTLMLILKIGTFYDNYVVYVYKLISCSNSKQSFWQKAKHLVLCVRSF